MDQSKIIICAVTNDLSQDQRMHRICTTLSKKYTVRLIGRKRNHSIPLDVFSFQTLRLDCWFDRSFLFYAEYNLRLFLYLMKQNFDCVNANDLDTLLACRLAAFFKRKRFVFDAHEIFTDVPELISAPVKRWIWKSVGSIFLQRSRHNYTVNESLSKHLHEKYKVPFQVVQNFPSLKQTTYSTEVRKPTRFIYQGAMNLGRGIENIIAAIQQIPEAELFLVGRGDLDKAISKLIQGYEDRIFFTGFLSPHELSALTKKCHIGFNVLSGDSLNYFFSSANKYFDYIMANIPCISMNFPEYQRANEQFETAILIPSYEVEHIIAAMKQMMYDNELYQRLQSNCSKAKMSFNWESQSDLLLAFYDRVIR